MAIHPLHPRAMNRGGEQRGGKGTSAPDGRGRVRKKSAGGREAADGGARESRERRGGLGW